MTGKLNHRTLHAQTQAQKWELLLTGVANGGNLTFHAPLAKATGH